MEKVEDTEAGKAVEVLHAGVNILHQRGELFPDEFAPKHLTLPYLLTKFWKMGNFSPMEYRGIIKNKLGLSKVPLNKG